MSITEKLSVAILGASGYTGAELIRLLTGHPHVQITALTGETQAGKTIGEVYPHLAFHVLPALVKHEEVDFSRIDLVFCCLPHGTTQPIIAGLPKHIKIIDLSADFRLHDTATYAQWYGHPHQAPQLQNEAVYGLTEWAREDIKQARLIANPGCYPTCSLLPLLPLVRQRLIETDNIIINAQSGVSGAGRAVKQGNLFAEINEGVSAYSVGNHRHSPEIEQALSEMSETEVIVSFTPHLAPMNRGMLATISVSLAQGMELKAIREALQNSYAQEAFVKLAAPGAYLGSQQVRGTNLCIMNVFSDRLPNRIILVSVIDNLVKGASGQAVQNMNVIYGWPEILGLPITAVFP